MYKKINFEAIKKNDRNIAISKTDQKRYLNSKSSHTEGCPFAKHFAALALCFLGGKATLCICTID